MIEEDLTVEEILKRCLQALHPLNEAEIKAAVATSHKVAIVDADNLTWVREALLTLLDWIEKMPHDPQS